MNIDRPSTRSSPLATRYYDENDTGPPFRWSVRDAALVFAASVLSHVYNGIDFGLGAHATQLVLVNALNDPALYPGDPFVGSLGQYCSWYWVAVAWLSRIFDTQAILIVSHVASRFALFAAVYDLSARLFPNHAVRFIALALVTLRLRAVLAGEVLISPLPTHTTFAFPLLAGGLVFAWRGRGLAAAVLLGFGCDCNVMTGLPATFIAGAGYAASRRRRSVFDLIGPAAAWLVVAAPAIWWASRSPPPDDPAEYYRAIRDVFWWHFDPFRWGLHVYGRLAACVLVLMLGLAVKPRTPFDRPLIASFAAVGLTWVFALCAARLPAFAPLMRLQLGRTAAIAVFVSAPLAAHAAWLGWTRRGPAGAALIAAVFVGWGAAHGWTAAGILLCAAQLADLRSPRSWNRLRIGNRVRWAALAAAAVAAGLFVQAIYRQAADPDASGVILRTAADDWRDVQEWAREHTPPDATFVAPLHVVGFRVSSHRPLWLGFDHDAMLWRPDLRGEIDRRHAALTAVGLAERPVRRIDWPRLQSLADAEGIDYAVVPNELVNGRIPECQSGRWSVVKLAGSR